MSRPSEPLLRWLRSRIDDKGENTSSLATKLGRPRSDVRRILTGAEPLLVDDLLRLSEILEISAEDMGVPAHLGDVPELTESEEAPESEHWGNQPMLLVKMGFRVGMDMLLFVETDALDDDWGGPSHVRERYKGQQIPLQLVSAYHEYMKPVFGEEALEVVLSFDSLYTLNLPWHAIRRVAFDPIPPEPPEEEEEAPVEERETSVPFLRLVT